jgi:ribosomal protein S6--L-glutamate ligase
MRIGILSRNKNLYSTRRLVEEGRNSSHETQVVDTLSIVVEVGATQQNDIKLLLSKPNTLSAGVWGLSRYATKRLKSFDAIIPRIGTTVTDYGIAVVRQFELQQVLTTATSQGIAQSRDKLHSMQLLQQTGLPTPKTAVIAKPESLSAAIRAVGGPPVIIKLAQGTQGRGVILARNLVTAKAVIDKLRKTSQQILIQEFIEEANGKDLRIIVVDNQCIAAMERKAPNGEYRSNLHLGGTAVSVQPDEHTSKLALHAAHAHGLAVAGVDILQSNRGPLILEINSSPGLEGIEGVTNKNVAKEIINYLEKISQRKPKRKSKR